MLLAASCLVVSDPAWVQERSPEFGAPFQSVLEFETTARLLALLLDSGRTVINENQPLYDDAQGVPAGASVDKPGGISAAVLPAPRESAPSAQARAEEFEAQLVEIFRSRSGLDLWDLQPARLPARAKELLTQLVTVSKQAVAEAQPGGADRRLGGLEFIPAVFGSRVAARFAETTGVRLKQTSLTPRNPANEPDPFERAALREFAGPAYPREQVISEVTATSRSLRLMYPLYTTRRCLECHGEPKGQPDRMGYPREGLRLGQNAGAISVVISLEK
jgi:general secretion pathway protein A